MAQPEPPPTTTSPSLRDDFETSVTVNGLVVVESLADDERKTGTYLVEDVQAAFLKEGVALWHASIGSKAKFKELISRLIAEARKGLRPVLHVEAHGLTDMSGLLLLPSREQMKWGEFADLCRTLNEVTKNNLVVVLATCSGFEATTGVDVLRTTPFCVMLGPSREVMNAELLGATSRFYAELFGAGSIATAISHLPNDYRVFNCEAMLIRAFVLYLENHARGRIGDKRMERLVTRARSMYPLEPVAVLRRWIKSQLKDNQRHFVRYHEKFLLSSEPENANRFSVTWPDVEAVLKKRK
jgi:hypothetical protein